MTAREVGREWVESRWRRRPDARQRGVIVAARHWKAVLDFAGLDGDDRDARNAAYLGACERWRELQAQATEEQA